MNASKKRVSVFIDGFNLYHAIRDLGLPHLRWVDLRKLASQFCDPKAHELRDVWYFSAYAKYRPQSVPLHKEYVKALKSTGVRCVMGAFKPKDRYCPSCHHNWKGHEEKQSDVNFAINLLHEAQQGHLDEAFLITGDSDLVPPVKLAKQTLQGITFKVISQPGRYHSKELVQITDRKASIKPIHLERALFPKQIIDPATGLIIATRPAKYDPPVVPVPAIA